MDRKGTLWLWIEGEFGIEIDHKWPDSPWILYGVLVLMCVGKEMDSSLYPFRVKEADRVWGAQFRVRFGLERADFLRSQSVIARESYIIKVGVGFVWNLFPNLKIFIWLMM